jgi:hypothetical protein
VDQSGDRVHHDDVEGVGTHERFANAQGFFAGARLGNKEIVEVYAQLPRIGGIERMLDIENPPVRRAFAPGRWRST